jgi:hypothetical protein
MTRSVIVNFADQVGWYPDGQARFVRTMREHGFDGSVCLFTDTRSLNCPSHKEVPYAFKVYAIREMRAQGYHTVFYGDASIYAVRDVTPVFTHINDEGYYLETTEHNLGTWCSDIALIQLGIDRETAFKIPTIVAGCVGFNFRTTIANEILDTWFSYAIDGYTFPGAWTNEHHQVSDDPRVRGHRHDQSALSGIAHGLKLKLLPFETYISYQTPPPPQTVFHCHPTI